MAFAEDEAISIRMLRAGLAKHLTTQNRHHIDDAQGRPDVPHAGRKRLLDDPLPQLRRNRAEVFS